MYSELLIEVARKYIGVHEVGGDNKGPDVERFQKAVDGKAQGEPWCMGFAQFCVKEVENASGILSELYRSEHCLTVWNRTPVHLRREAPEAGCLVIWQMGSTSAGHVGIIESVQGMNLQTIEGNTGDGTGIVREGDGVYRKHRLLHGSDKMKIVGFLKPFL